MNKAIRLSGTGLLLLAVSAFGCARSAPQDAPSPASAQADTSATARSVDGDAGQRQRANANFDGDWAVEWCDRSRPDADCGGFGLSLLQDHDRLCGTYGGARAGLAQIDDGGPRAVLGAVVGDVAILTLHSTRSGDIYLVQASVDGDSMRWKVLDTVLNVDGDVDVVAYDDTLARKGHGTQPSERYASAVEACTQKK